MLTHTQYLRDCQTWINEKYLHLKCLFWGKILHLSLAQLGDVALYYTYEAMEEEIERNKDHPDFSPLYFPELNRRDALSRDLDYFYGEDWRERVSCSPATQRYVERIHQVSNPEVREVDR